MELGVLPTTVDDDNVKKAEAYSKDLDDVIILQYSWTALLRYPGSFSWEVIVDKS